MPAMIQLANGSSWIPSRFGSEYMMYSSVRKPGASIVIHPILPGMLKRKVVEVLPEGYQG